MQSHDQHLVIVQKLHPSKFSKDKSNQTFVDPRVCWSTISHSKKHDKSNNIKKRLSRFDGCSTIIDANNSNVIACDLDELFCENVSNEERTTCPRISSSTEFKENDMCATYKDYVECQLQQQNSAAASAKVGKTEGGLTNDQDEEPTEHLDYYKSQYSDISDVETSSTSSTIALIEHGEVPILVDLTSEESITACKKQTILKSHKVEESSEMSEPRIMIADSSSRLQQRSGTGSSLATALRDRGPCVIPVQPNRSLPIRPAPPTPTRSASIVTLRKPILKLSKSANSNVVELQSNANDLLTSELSEFSFEQQDGNENKMMLTSEFIDRSDYILPDMNAMQITQEVNSIKRKNSEDRDKEFEKEITKDVKKRRKSQEVDHIRDERIKNILKEYSKTCSDNSADQGERKLQQHVMIRLWDNKKYSSPVMSTTEPEKKEICNKVVPPLRLKKIARKANTVDEYRRNIEVNAEGTESNYRIVTGATPRPESPSGYSTASSWSSVASENELESSDNARDKSRRSSPKSDGYKIKYRRNRLRQKLRELRSKALELSREMTACNNTADISPQHNTRLQQMMNCYEKQIENISKLLCKLSASIPPTSDDIAVDLDYENEINECTSVEKTAVDIAQIEKINEISGSVSLSPSPEPPKLSPRSPIDYEKGKSPDTVRNSPPVLPRVYIAIQPTALECLKQNLIINENWHKNDSSPNSPNSSLEKEVKVNEIDRMIIHDDVTAISLVSSSEFEDSRNNPEWNEEDSLPKLKNQEIEEKIPEDTKTFSDIEKHRQITPTISSESFLGSTMDLEIDGSNMRDTKERPVAQEYLNEETQVSETVANKQIACEQELKSTEIEQKSNETLSSCPSIVEETRKITEYGTYSEERINVKNRVVTSTVTTAQKETMVSQVPAANVTNILQLQSNYYGSSVAREDVVFTDVMQNSRDSTQKVTSSMNQSTVLDPAMPLGFVQSRSTVSSSNQQCVVLPNSCNRATQENTNQRNDGNRIMTEQFPTLGNWVARMSKKQATKSKSKLQSGINLPSAPTAEAVRVSGLEAQKMRSNAPNNATRNNIVNVAPQWNTERWQRQQYQQRQQQLYASSAIPPVRPSVCPNISVTQFYPSNYAIDPYGAAFGYHSAVCPYGDYPYHSRLHATAPPISGYQLGPLQDSHASSLRQMQHLDKRYPAHLQDATSRHFTADLLKYSGTLSTGGYQPASATAAAGLDYDRLRTATAATQNGTACLRPLLLPPPPPLVPSAQQSLARTSLTDYPAGNGQCGRNRMIPDVVAAAAAAAVVAAASFGRQRGTLPSYGRTDTEMVSGGIGGIIDNESSQLMANRVANREHISQEQVQPVGGVNVDSRLNNGGYRQLQNLILDRLPYAKADDTYSQSSTAIFDDNVQKPTVATSVPTSTYKSTTILTSSNTLAAKEPTRKKNRNCETPHLGKVNRTLETTSNLECSNCGLTGSMFKCLGCETTFYCDEICQTRHWSIHVEKCPKRMRSMRMQQVSVKSNLTTQTMICLFHVRELTRYSDNSVKSFLHYHVHSSDLSSDRE